MSAFALLVIYSWPGLVILLLALVERKRAVTLSFALGWCMLPVVSLPLSGLPDYTKTSATIVGILAGTCIFHAGLLLTLRPCLLDIPVAIYCMCPIASSIANGLGWYDGQSGMLDHTITWGIPYLIGRIHFSSMQDLGDFTWPIIACAVLYVPLCLYEIRMSPQLHAMTYGFLQHNFAQTMRGGGWRPMVFMSHGLQVGMWFAIASLQMTGWIVAARQSKVQLFGFNVPAIPLGILLVITLGLLKSTGAIILAIVGVSSLLVSQRLRSVIPALAIGFLCIVYIAIRITGVWDGTYLVQQAQKISPDRAGSLQFRIDNEDILVKKAAERPVFGWGGWGRARVYDEEGNDISVTDGAWIIAFGNNGIVGLIGLYGTMLLGPTALLFVCPVRDWRDKPETALGACLAITCFIAAADSLPNAHQIPVMTMGLGVCVGIFQGERQRGARLFF